MPRWKNCEVVFIMNVVDDGKGSRYVRIPKPVDKVMKNPTNILFEINGKQIIFKAVTAKSRSRVK